MLTKMKTYFKEIGWKRFVYMVLAIVFLGIGVSLLRLAGFGTDPFSCMVFGLVRHMPIGYGTLQIILNMVMFIPVIILYPRSFGAGAFFNMIGLGYIVDLCLYLCGICNVTVEGLQGMLIARVILLFAGICVMCFGIALYMECDLGIAPYDMIAQLIEDKTHRRITFKWGRILTDMVCIFIGFVTGGTVGLATVVVGFFTGPVVSFFRGMVRNNLLKMRCKDGTQD